MTSALDLASFQCIEMAIYDSSNFSGGTTWDLLNGPSSYQYFTGSGFQNDIKILELYNGSNVLIILSFTMITVNVMGTPTNVNVQNATLPAGATKIIDLQANHADTSSYGSGTLNGKQGQLVWGNAAAGTGNVYISGYS